MNAITWTRCAGRGRARARCVSERSGPSFWNGASTKVFSQGVQRYGDAAVDALDVRLEVRRVLGDLLDTLKTMGGFSEPADSVLGV